MAEIVKPVVHFRWGIISTGWIASCFVKDLLVDPKTRGVEDIVHVVAAVGSRSVSKAQEFIKEFAGGDEKIKAYGTYEEVYADPDVDAIYIGTPHTYHYTNALASIKAGKHVLCEKPVTCNAAELQSLLAAAKEHNVFFMEAVWTRFQPLSLEVKKIAESGVLGKPVLVHADLSGNFGIEDLPPTHRILDPVLGGGALLDLGPYPLFWAILALYENPSNKLTQPTSILGSMVKVPPSTNSSVDSSSVFSLTFSDGDLHAQASLSCSITLNAIETGVTLRFERGSILVKSPIYCPKEFTVQYLDLRTKKVAREEKRIFEYVGGGWHFQADEVARCVRDGRKESALWGHDKSLLEMKVFDEVRRQGGYVFPEGVEKVKE